MNTTPYIPRSVLAFLFTLGLMLPSLQLRAQQEEEENEDIFTLNPFSVDEQDNVGYLANSSLAGTRLKTPLRDLATTVSVVTKEFIEDTNSTDLQELLVYTAGTEINGIGGNFANPNENRVVGAIQDTQFKRPNTSNRVRGLATADLTRDYFATIIPMDAYNTDRVVINRGANAILFGLGSPAGIINSNTIKPVFENHGEVSFQIGSYGSTRATLDVEQVLVENKLSLRVATLYKDRKYQQEPAFDRDKRIFAVGEFRPWENSTFRLSYEKGDIDANRPRTLPPQDMVTRWFDPSPTGSPKPTHDPHNNFQLFLYRPGGDTSGATQEDVLDNLYFGPIGFTFEAAVAYDNPDQAVAGGTLPGGQEGFVPIIHPRYGADATNGISFQSFVTLRGVEQLYDNMLGMPRDQNGNLKSETRSFYVNEHIIDTSLFDFRNLLIDGPNKSELEDFEVVNFSFEQVFLEGNAGFAYYYNQESYESHFSSVLADGSRFQAIAIDPNVTFPNGDPNPNFGRLFISAGANGGRTASLDEDRESHRATAFFRFDATDRVNGWLGEILGDHTLTGLFEDADTDRNNKNLLNYAWDSDFQVFGTPPNPNNVTGVGTLVYVSDDISGQSSSAGANASNLKTKLDFQSQYNLTYFDRNTNMHVDSGVFGVRRDLPLGASLNKNAIESKAFILNSKFLEDHIVATYGYREDDVEVWTNSNPPRFASNGSGTANVRDLSPDVFFLPDTPTFTSSTDATNFGVVAHVPDAWMNSLGSGIGLSFHYADAENAQIGTERTNLEGDKLGPVSGTTEEYGFTFSFLENRFSVRVNWYETLQLNDDSGLTGAFNATMGRILVNYAPVTRQRNIETNLGGFDDIDDLANYESAFDNAQWVLETINAEVTEDGEGVNRNNPTGLTFPTDLLSEGMEIEGVANITSNWRLLFNITKQEVTSANTAPLFARFIRETVDPLLDRFGKFSTSADQVESILSWTNRVGLISAKTAIAADGGVKTNEIRKWRANLITNYDFDNEKLRGFNVGGAVRWQDKVGIGRPVINDPELGFIPDLANPIFGPTETQVDAWIGWEKELGLIFGKDTHLKVQLNIRNLLDKDDLIPVVANPDTTIPVVRIPAERTYELRGTLSF